MNPTTRAFEVKSVPRFVDDLGLEAGKESAFRLGGLASQFYKSTSRDQVRHKRFKRKVHA